MSTTRAGYTNLPLENQLAKLGEGLFVEALVFKNVIVAVLHWLSINLLVLQHLLYALPSKMQQDYYWFQSGPCWRQVTPDLNAGSDLDTLDIV